MLVRSQWLWRRFFFGTGQSATPTPRHCYGPLPPPSRPWLLRSLAESAAFLTLVGCRACRGPRRATNGRTVLRCGPVALKASDPMFADVLDEGPTEAAYANTVMESMSGHEQGKLCEMWARQTLQKIHPEWEISDPEAGTCCNGSKRNIDRAPHDFLIDGRKVETKSARITCGLHDQTWRIRFWQVHVSLPEENKQARLHDLFLVIASPKGLHLIKHDLCTGICSDGKRTNSRGHTVTVKGCANDACWEEALNTILQKLCQVGTCKLIAKCSFGDVFVKHLLAKCRDCRHLGQTVYDGVPMQNMHQSRRGLQFQQMALAIDQNFHPDSCISLLDEAPEAAGSHLRHSSNASADWIRDGAAVEVKSSKLLFGGRLKAWSCHFRCLKPSCYDELWLVLYCPWDIRFYSNDSLAGLSLSSQGLLTDDMGHDLIIYGPSNCEDPLRAFEVIEEKILSRGFALRAIVRWD